MNSGGPKPGGARAWTGSVRMATLFGTTYTAAETVALDAGGGTWKSVATARSAVDRVPVVIFSQQSVERTRVHELALSSSWSAVAQQHVATTRSIIRQK